MPNGLYVVVILETIEQLAHLGHILFLLEGDVVLRNHLDLRLNELVAEFLERLADSREVIQRGADQLGWELEKLLTMTMEAMKATEDTINAECESL